MKISVNWLEKKQGQRGRLQNLFGCFSIEGTKSFAQTLMSQYLRLWILHLHQYWISEAMVRTKRFAGCMSWHEWQWLEIEGKFVQLGNKICVCMT